VRIRGYAADVRLGLSSARNLSAAAILNKHAVGDTAHTSGAFVFDPSVATQCKGHSFWPQALQPKEDLR
jgi:hypothetical protein